MSLFCFYCVVPVEPFIYCKCVPSAVKAPFTFNTQHNAFTK